MIDRLEKELEVSDVRERELQNQINDIEEEMYRSKLEINKRKKTLVDLEEMERNALETGDKVEVERIKRIQGILKTSANVEANTRKIHSHKKAFFLRWQASTLSKRSKTLLFASVLTRATKNAENNRVKGLCIGWESFKLCKLGGGAKSSKPSGALLEQHANLQSQIDSYNKD